MKKNNNIMTDFFIFHKNDVLTFLKYFINNYLKHIYYPDLFVLYLGNWIFGLTMLLNGHPFCNMDGPLTTPNLLAWVFCPNGKNGLEAPLSS